MSGKRGARRRPALTEEGRENQLVSSAIDLAEKQIANGTASSAVVTHFLKLGSSREKLEQERLKNENALLRAKVESYESAKQIQELYTEALQAMRSYAGQEVTESYDDVEEVF